MSSLADEHNTLPKPTRRHIKLDKVIFGFPWLLDLWCKHWFASSIWNFCRWVANVPPRERSPAAKSEEKRMFSQAKIWKTMISRRRYFKPLVPTPVFGSRLRCQNFNHAPRQYRQLRRLRTFTHLICVNHIKITRYTSRPWIFTVHSEWSKFIKDSFNVFLLNVGSYCPFTIVELFTNLSR